MLKKNIIILFLSFTLTSTLFCQYNNYGFGITINKNYYLNVNQKAQNLSKNQAENVLLFSCPVQLGPSIHINHDLTDQTSNINLMGLFRLTLTHGFMTRYGINEYVENQSKFNNIHMFSFGVFGGYIFTYENAFKYNFFKTDLINLSILHFIGISFGGTPYDRYSMFDFSFFTGIKFIGDYKNFFYGFIFSIKNNIFILAFNRANEYSFPELGLGISIGGEVVYKKIVIRHDLTLACTYFYHYKYYYEDYYLDYIDDDEVYDHNVNITFDYTFTFGWRWFKNIRNRNR